MRHKSPVHGGGQRSKSRVLTGHRFRGRPKRSILSARVHSLVPLFSPVTYVFRSLFVLVPFLYSPLPFPFMTDLLTMGPVTRKRSGKEASADQGEIKREISFVRDVSLSILYTSLR